ncbi:hypothetical protein ElyMa_003047700 [Elysia marginata]|uniref:Uncharacterized protein n=1 Tax=Elysia marginata TaxID=1093978 RepID=A0AAV4IED7_9GAST|nr:hypothetical protein ElyMa_003047700 [Elysia marginata]
MLSGCRDERYDDADEEDNDIYYDSDCEDNGGDDDGDNDVGGNAEIGGFAGACTLTTGTFTVEIEEPNGIENMWEDQNRDPQSSPTPSLRMVFNRYNHVVTRDTISSKYCPHTFATDFEVIL